jgi:hypothetical protein
MLNTPPSPWQWLDRIPAPSSRWLRGYAFDPSLSIKTDTVLVNEIIFKVIWEDLKPGPIGDYLEVIDYDPASQCFYAPVNLNHLLVIAQDGLAPSESTPQFHQQMVYAVAMTTIRNFELALGRLALWAPRLIRSDTGEVVDEKYVGQLRIYPHGLRAANAYYSPDKQALLFGYFPAKSTDPASHLPGGTVFSCLSHDIIAHETSHALLDGMCRRLIEATNPDVLAFHEAFADIVALFQHFSFPEILRHQIAQTRGNLAEQSLLGQLAQEFGQATGRYGALRDAIGKIDPQTKKWVPQEPDPNEYQTVLEPHKRGSILVAAVFDAFLTIYKNRVGDLLRIATNGSGILPAGALHPDLVNRLADEAAKSAQHVLHACIRALDYLPPVDITFGEYLRAIITADFDLVREDDRGYRIAFIEAFRRRGIYPRGIRSLSEESLRWPKVRAEDYKTLFEPIAKNLLQEFADNASYFKDREQIYKQTNEVQAKLHKLIEQALGEPKYRSETLLPGPEVTGLVLTAESPHLQVAGVPVEQFTRQRDLNGDGVKDPAFEISAIRPVQRAGPKGNILNHLVITITQKRNVPTGDGETITFRGGCTLVLDLSVPEVHYCITKSIIDNERLQRQLSFQRDGVGASLQATYLAENGRVNEPFALLHSDF